MPLIELLNLETDFDTENGKVNVLRNVNLEVRENTRHALIGQSGAGKSILALTLLRLLPDNARFKGKALYKGVNLLTCQDDFIRKIRGKEIMMIFQNPATTLNPVRKIGSQICEIPIYHEGVSYSEAYRRAVETISLCGLSEPEKIMRSYSFELSGGMLQRVVMAMGIICRPNLLIADEPFKGLDARLQQKLASTFFRVCRELEISLLLITHNLKIAQNLCDVVSVMYEGRVIETSKSNRFFSGPQHDYSKKLVRAFDLFNNPESADEMARNYA